MYLLITIIHTLFIYSAYILGYYFLLSFFIFLFGFFLLYFSPIFFSKEKIELPTLSLEKYSFKNSLILPLGFLYIAGYLFLFWLLGDFEKSFTISIYAFVLGYILFFGYMMMFEWKNDIFFDITRLHTILSLLIVFILTSISFFSIETFSYEKTLLSWITLLFGYFFFRTSKKEVSLFFQMYLLSWIFFIYSILTTTIFTPSFGVFLTIVISTSIILFESIPYFSFFTSYAIESRKTILSIILFSLLSLIGISFLDFSFFPSILLGFIFLISVHVRYSNYIALGCALISLFFLYSEIFFSLLTPDSLLSSLLFLFFLPVCIIGSTYFSEEKFEYDFSVLHYSAIIFSAIFFVYALIFVWWGWDFFFLLSGWSSLFALLLLLSYFRFRYK